jgi:hypothetical protein
MKRRTMLLLVMVLVLSLAAIGAVQAKTPGTADRSGDLVLSLNVGALPGNTPLDGITWYGTVEFDEILYDIVYRTTPPVGNEVVTHWTESWQVFNFEGAGLKVIGGVITDYDAHAVPLMTGFDKGITHLKNATWLGNGPVLTADGPFAQWEGHRAHTKGVVDFATLTGIGTLRLN